MRTAEEIYQEIGNEVLSKSVLPDPMEIIIKAINIARVEAIQECASFMIPDGNALYEKVIDIALKEGAGEPTSIEFRSDRFIAVWDYLTEDVRTKTIWFDDIRKPAIKS